MASRSSRLPSRFPVGTKFVIESRPRESDPREGDQVQIFTRYIEFPDGTFLPLPQHPAKDKREPKKAAKAARRRTRSRTTH
jgi:hypothetical protein